ncbi:MAG: hypothetical protein H6Q05_2999 [Acidobacteria bacterium]|nr:hypothetical protein [Acidobacteriota bacterium]
MRGKLVIAVFALTAGLAAAQEKPAEQLRKAIVEEEANQSLDKAVQMYQSILSQFDELRKTAATAQFHLAGCYRKQGKNELAIAAYKRIVQEFSDQTELVGASRKYLSNTFGVSQDQIPARERAARDQQVNAARQTYRRLLQDEILLVEDQIKGMQKKVEVGMVSPTGSEMIALKRELLDLQRNMAAFDAGVLPIAGNTKK